MQFFSQDALETTLPIKMSNEYISVNKQTRLLRLILYEKLTWQAHIDMLSTKISSICYTYIIYETQ